MRIEALLPRQSGACRQCPEPTPCSCSPDQDCFQINRDCNTCSQTRCVARASSSGSQGSGGPSRGAVAGVVVGVLLFLGAAGLLFVWYRRSLRQRGTPEPAHEIKNDVPAPAETVLNRPDPTEKSPSVQGENTLRVYTTSSNTTIDLDPEAQKGAQTPLYSPSRRITSVNPFDDNNSIQTAGTEGTNVIPIALVAPDSHRILSHTPQVKTRLSTQSSLPVRPPRSPELNLNLDHVNVSRDSVRPYAASQISGISGMSSRNSYMSNASYSSDFLNEAPMIITPVRGAVRQVVGVVKAEVINAPGSLSPGQGSHTFDTLKPPIISSRPSVGSPLASTSFGPADVDIEADETKQAMDPFSDELSVHTNYSASPAASVTTFGQPSPRVNRESPTSKWVLEVPNLPWARSGESRPSSMSTQAGSIADISNATRVNVGLNAMTSQPNGPRSPFRTTMGRLVPPPVTGPGTLEEQQQKALAHAQAQAQAQGLDKIRRISGSSVVSAASTRADSILESFPFVPPSPISDRPIRSPISPLAQSSFTSGTLPSPIATHIINVAPPSPLAQQVFDGESSETSLESGPLRAPPSRRTLGLSTASELSTASSGLGSFPFQIDSGAESEQGSMPPTAFGSRQRASLDTLALTSDLSSYPLGFDRDSVQVPLPKQ